jgi:hypothetical protein
MADKMSAREIDAIERFQTEQAREKAETQSRNRTIEDIYIDAFTAYTEGEKTMPHIMETLAALAAFFHDGDPEFHADNSDPNNMQFNQRGFMANLCQQADWMLQREERRMQYLRIAAQKARRSNLQGEIDTLELERAELDYGRSKIVNMPILTDFKVAAKAAHVVQFGDDWVRQTKPDTRATTEALEDRFQHSERRRRL